MTRALTLAVLQSVSGRDLAAFIRPPYGAAMAKLLKTSIRK